MAVTAPRRWFRFSLRTMLVVVTMLGCWLGYQFNWIRQRNEFAEGLGAAQRYIDRAGESLDTSALDASPVRRGWNCSG